MLRVSLGRQIFEQASTWELLFALCLDRDKPDRAIGLRFIGKFRARFRVWESDALVIIDGDGLHFGKLPRQRPIFKPSYPGNGRTPNPDT